MSQELQKRDNFIQSVGGLVLQVIGPALVMVVIGSLAFFLIEVIYGGPLVERVKWIFALFVFAAVLISRISIELGFERATFYGFLLAGATLMVLSRYLSGNLLLLFAILMFIWWCASRLTWDCTFIDETRDITGQGMIDLAIERVTKSRQRGEARAQANQDAAVPDGESVRISPEPVTDSESGARTPASSPWNTFVGIFFKRRQANTPGLWAFYFLIAALPLFGIGQLFLRMNDAAAHRAAAFHFFTYMVGILCLLMVTSLLGLHRYLSTNQSAIPVRVAKRWMLFGVILAILILGFTFWLPRPMPQYSIASWFDKLTSRYVDPSQVSFGKDGQKKGDNSNVNSGPNSRENRQDPDKTSSGDSGNAKSSGDKGGSGSGGDNPKGNSSSQGKKGSGGKHNQGKQESSGASNKSGKQKSKQQQSSPSAKGEKSKEHSQSSPSGDESDKQKKGDQSKDRSQDKSSRTADSKDDSAKGGNDKNKKQESKGLQNPRKSQQFKQQQRAKQRDRSGGSSSKRQQSSQRQQDQSKTDRSNTKQKNKSGSEDRNDQSSLNQAMSVIGSFLRTLFYFLILAILIWFAWKYRHQLLPQLKSFLAELAEFWRRLWGQKPKSAEESVVTPTPRTVHYSKFADFANPFATGKASQWSPAQIVDYSFRAFEAWARDRHRPRDPDQTPHEFVRQASDATALEPIAKEFAEMYCTIAYSKGTVTRAQANTLSRLWDAMSVDARLPAVVAAS